MTISPQPSSSITPGMRAVFWASVVLVFLAGTALFVFTESTETLFAWTIASPLTAAFLGAAYWASLPVAYMTTRQRVWGRTRAIVPPIFVFTTVMFLATILHLDRFHLSAPSPGYTIGLTWFWLFVYGLLPPALLIILIRQLRHPGSDEFTRKARFPGWLKIGFWVISPLMILLAAGLFLAPGTFSPLWPWALTPLTARATAAWLAGLGAAGFSLLWEDDVTRIQAATLGMIAFGVLEAIAVVRYGSEMDWSKPSSYLFVGMLAGVLIGGVLGLRLARRAEEAAPAYAGA